MVTLRRYAPADCDATVEIFLRAIREVASNDYTPAQIEAWAQVDDRQAWAERRSSRPTWIAEAADLPIGFADLESDGHLDMMFVHPGHQGIGAATALLRTIEAEARALGLSRIFTEASLTARPFFQRRGFVVLTCQSVEKRGQALANFRMRKLLP
ncbi:Acetyltransferase, GNAT family [Rhizobium tibeticum]|uniref:Acetyltransferase, GNAT family n=1 Tax=Rhizobium tibeticum TaxID=501024 RepID=A0A1H8SUU1_9HYPH|nr:GNAT family N-acetyltransferase [Rhizobium tibeticum]SEI13680.1 putative N-acetyltransferase YafP [Rhizobium tibeticum]SEO82367.1 Acetyltransferase, GNAT family [Rhizobium tibeticum]